MRISRTLLTLIVSVVVQVSTGHTQAPNFAKATFLPTFADSGQDLGDDRTFGLAVGDIDGDGDVDLVVSNYQGSSRVWKNDGHGVFIDSGQRLGSYSSHGVALGDFDNDGDLDAFLVFNGSADRIFFNDGGGRYTDSGQRLGQTNGHGLSVTLGDLDSAGPLPGSGEGGLSITLGDVDQDRDLDLFIGMNDGFGGNRLSLCTIPRETVRTPSGRISRLP